MCGRAVRKTPARDLAKLFDAQLSLEHASRLDGSGPAFNLGPTQDLAAVRTSSEGERELVPLYWGLLPPWAKADGPKRPPMLNNARSETVTDKRTFSVPFEKGRRCLVLVDGFYEWKREDRKHKRPFYFHRDDDAPLAMAGLWQYNKSFDKETGTVLTCAANALMAPVHDRMPCLLLDEDAQRLWLDPDAETPALLDLLTPHKDQRLARYEVSQYVNNIRHQGEQCTAPLEDAAPLTENEDA
jgi:putative SOS response-associated peptidase YedK